MIVDTRAVIDLVRLRLSLPSEFDRAPLDTLLERLTETTVAAPARTPSRSLRRALRIGEAMVARLPGVPSTCLYRALARYAVLRARAVPARFVLGVAPGDVDVAHAWIEILGAPYEEPLYARYVETYSYPPRSSETSHGPPS